MLSVINIFTLPINTWRKEKEGEGDKGGASEEGESRERERVMWKRGDARARGTRK